MNNIILSLSIVYFYIQVLFHIIGLYTFIEILRYIKKQKKR
jgi:hypothetical protein